MTDSPKHPFSPAEGDGGDAKIKSNKWELLRARQGENYGCRKIYLNWTIRPCKIIVFMLHVLDSTIAVNFKGRCMLLF